MYLALILLIPLMVCAETFFAGVGAWIIGWFFGDTILGIFAQLGISNVSMFDLGLFLGFISSLLHVSVSLKKE